MGEKLYRPIIKDGDHLVKSTSNPDRYRGQSRDADNKNPDIIEWEEVDVEDSSSDYSYMGYDYQQQDDSDDQSTLELFVEALENINKILEFLNEHPEMIEAIVKGGLRVKNFVVDRFGRIKRYFMRGKESDTSKAVIEGETALESTVKPNDIVAESSSLMVEEKTDDKNMEAEELSLEDARNLMIDTLANYLKMRRNIERLSKAKIKNVSTAQIEMDQMLMLMDEMVKHYPLLMDEKTSNSILEMLRSNVSDPEKKLILESLKIDVSRCNELS